MSNEPNQPGQTRGLCILCSAIVLPRLEAEPSALASPRLTPLTFARLEANRPRTYTRPEQENEDSQVPRRRIDGWAMEDADENGWDIEATKSHVRTADAWEPDPASLFALLQSYAHAGGGRQVEHASVAQILHGARHGCPFCFLLATSLRLGDVPLCDQPTQRIQLSTPFEYLYACVLGETSRLLRHTAFKISKAPSPVDDTWFATDSDCQ